MDQDAFQNSSSGRIVRTMDGYDTFIPNPPPTDITFNTSFIRLVIEAERALGRLVRIGSDVSDHNLLVIPYTHLEAVTSTRIEGTQASLSEVLEFEATPSPASPSHDLREVLNYLDALNYGLDRLQSLPLSLRLVREIHERLMSGVRGGSPGMTPGEFRRSQNWIGPAGCTLSEATYVPPPPGDPLNHVLKEWENFINEREILPELLQCGMMHYQFEAIHPFHDGNGRTGRLLIIQFLCERGVLPKPLLYLSAFFERYRNEYYERLLKVSQVGDWDGWLRFFLRGVVTQSNQASDLAKRIIELRESYRKKLHEKRMSSSVLRLLDYVFAHPYFNLKQVSDTLNISFNTAQSAVLVLEKEGIVREITGQKRNRVYATRQLIDLLNENEFI